MRRFGLGLGLLGLLLIFGVPQLGQAATSTTACACFCGTSAGGAQLLGTKDSNTACASACAPSSSFSEPDSQYVGCYTNESLYPAKSDLCWTEDQCVLNNAENTWDDAVPTCADDGPGSIHMGYCYKVPPKINVMTVIGGETQFNTIGDYISAIYQMLIPFMSIVAVVMIMIGGLQYTLARGNPKAITQAKERITKAVIGFVLLMSAFVLANLLDPSLTHLRLLRIPLIKEVVLLDANSTCEYLSSVGFQVDGVDTAKFKSKTCGTTGSITSIAEVRDDVSIGSWKVGSPCIYSQCSGGGACAADAAGTKYSCQTCTSVTGEAASVASCAAHQAPDESSSIGVGKKYYCEYISGSGQVINKSGDLAETAACVDVGGTAGYLNCTQMRAYTTSGGSSSGGSCRSYDAVEFQYTNDTATGAINHVLPFDGGYKNSDLVNIFTDLCTSDPCGLATSGQTGCQAIASSTGLDCVGHSDIVTTSTDGISGTCYGQVAGSLVNCTNGEPISR